MYHYRTGGIFRQLNAFIEQRRLLVKHIIDNPAPAPTGGVVRSLANRGGLAGPSGLAGLGGGLAG